MFTLNDDKKLREIFHEMITMSAEKARYDTMREHALSGRDLSAVEKAFVEQIAITTELFAKNFVECLFDNKKALLLLHSFVIELDE